MIVWFGTDEYDDGVFALSVRYLADTPATFYQSRLI